MRPALRSPTIVSLFFVLAASLTPICAQVPNYPPSNPPPPDLDEQLEKSGRLLVLDCNGTGKQFVIGAPRNEPTPVNFRQTIKVDLANNVVELLGGETDDAKIDNETISFTLKDKHSETSIKIDRRTGLLKLTAQGEFLVSSVEGTCDNISGRRKF